MIKAGGSTPPAYFVVWETNKMPLMIAPAHRRMGARQLYVNQEQARILRAVGWTEATETREIRAEMVVSDGGVIAANAKPKRKYTRRNKDDGDKPKRQYRRRDMQAEE